MQLEKKSQYYLKRARATAKEIEFKVPDELKATKDVESQSQILCKRKIVQ